MSRKSSNLSKLEHPNCEGELFEGEVYQENVGNSEENESFCSKLFCCFGSKKKKNMRRRGTTKYPSISKSGKKTMCGNWRFEENCEKLFEDMQ